MRILLAVLVLLVPLAGCGRTGPPRPPGPADAVTARRPYPAPASYAPGQLPSQDVATTSQPAQRLPSPQDLPR